jgi:hypothetical protein
MKTTLVAAILAIVTLLTVGVGFTATAQPSPKGTLVGGIIFTGRIPPGYPKTGYQRGLVQVVRRGDVVASAHLHRGQRYRFVLRAHTYTLRTPGNAPLKSQTFCSRRVTIRASRTLRANVYCVFH